MRLEPSQTVRRVLVGCPIGRSVVLETNHDDGVARIDCCPQRITQLFRTASH